MSTSMERTIDRMAKDVFCDFLTIAIHGVLHSRQIYPIGAFKLRQKFGIPVQVCYHPEVFGYVKDITDSLANTLKSRKLHSMHIFIGTAAADWEQISIKLHAFRPFTSQAQLNDLQSSLKSCLLKLFLIDTYLPRRITGDVTWRIEIDAEDKEIENNQATDWLRVDDGPRSVSATRPNEIIPLKDVTNDSIKLEIFAQKLF